jgi:hypothetical protein
MARSLHCPAKQCQHLTGDEEGVPATLTLKPDDNFEQTVTHDGIVKHAQGTWTLSPSGDIVSSESFIKSTGNRSVRMRRQAPSAGPEHIQIEIAVNSKFARAASAGRSGLVSSHWGVSEDNRKAKYYRLAAVGKKQLLRETTRWHQMIRALRFNLAVRGPQT